MRELVRLGYRTPRPPSSKRLPTLVRNAVAAARRGCDVSIYYSGPPNHAFDAELEDALLTEGLTWWASGYSHITDVRDVAFEPTD